MAIWADGDALTPGNMNNQHLSSLSAGTGTSIASGLVAHFVSSDAGGSGPSAPTLFVQADVTGATTGSAQGIEAAINLRHSSGSVALAICSPSNFDMGSSASVTEARVFQAGITPFTGTGSVDTVTGVFISFPSSASIRELVGFDALRGATWSGGTNYAMMADAPVSLVSSSASTPSALSGRGYLYVSDIGALFWVGGSGSSTTVGIA